MEVKVAGSCMYWSQRLASQSPSSSSHTSLASSVSSTLSSSRKRRDGIQRTPLVCQIVHKSPLFGTTSTKLSRTQSCEIPKSRDRTLRRSVSTNLASDGFFDDEFAKEIQELAQKFNITNDNEDENNKFDAKISYDSRDTEGESSSNSSYNSFSEELSKISQTINHHVQNTRPFPPLKIDSVDSSLLGIGPDPPDWAGLNNLIPASVEMKANSLDLPFSLRILKKKNQWQEEFREAGKSACCSVKKAFNSMLFIIEELHSYTLQMREFLFYENIQGIIGRVQKEVHASFVWLFQEIFSHTPTLMVYVMILLANFTVHSMAQNAAIAAYPRIESHSTITEIVSTASENQNQNQDHQEESKLDVSSSGKMTFLGGNKGGGGGGGNIKSGASSGTDGGDGGFNGFSSINHHSIVPDEISKVTSFGNTSTNQEETTSSGLESEKNQEEMREDEMALWNSVVEEASKMQDQSKESILDHETMKRFVSPVKVEIDSDLNNTNYFKTELIYQESLLQEPNNPLLLSNYAQFLYLVVHDHDRAEEYFKRAASVEPADAEALSHYANFLWMAKNEIEAAEEKYLEAIEADPGNMFYAGSYANFLWNTGGEDTCYPLDSLNQNEA